MRHIVPHKSHRIWWAPYHVQQIQSSRHFLDSESYHKASVVLSRNRPALFTRSFRPSLYIGMCVIAWGLTSTLTGVRHHPNRIIDSRPHSSERWPIILLASLHVACSSDYQRWVWTIKFINLIETNSHAQGCLLSRSYLPAIEMVH